MSDVSRARRREFVKVAGTAAVGASLFPGRRLRASRPPNAATPSSAPATAPAACGGATSSRRTPTCSSSSASATSTRSARVVASDFIGAQLPHVHQLRRDDRQDEARPADGDDRRRLPSRIHRQGTRPRHRRDDREADDDRRDASARRSSTPRSGTTGKIVVTFNYRYAPAHQQMKEILMSDEIGKVVSVDFSWYLDVDSRRRLFPPVAPAAQQRRIAARPQGEPSFRSDELVARRGSGGSLRLRRPAGLRQERHVPRHRTAGRARTSPSAASTTT